MKTFRFIEKIHAIKCCESKHWKEANSSFIKVLELKNEIMSGINNELLESKISTWRDEQPKVTDTLLRKYEDYLRIE